MEQKNGKVSKVEIYIAVIVGIALVMGTVTVLSSLNAGPYDHFAQCLTKNNVTFYGAFWCPHCAQQKELFGNSMRYVNYVECSTPNLKPTQACISANITQYPTWQFGNGSRVSSVLTIQNLSSLSGCSLGNNS